MKKNIVILLVLLFIFNACSSSSDDGGSSSPTELLSILQANKWIMRDASYGEGDKDHMWVDVEHTTLYFTSDAEGVVYWVQRDYDTDLGNHKTYDYQNFSYKISGKDVILNTETDINYLTYSGDYLVEGSSIYEKATMGSGDYEILQKIAPKTGNCGSNLSFVYYPKTCELKISGKGEMKDYTSTNQPWHDCRVESVNIEEGCTYIGKNAFVGKLELGTVKLPNTLAEIGDNSFSGTTITKVSIPDNVTIIGRGAFLDCNYLQTVYLGNNLIKVGDEAFAGCAIKNQDLTLPNSVEEVGNNAFGGWQAGTLKLNEKLKTIGMSAFVGVKGTLNIPNSVESIGFLAFDGPFSKIIVGSGLKKLSQAAFGGSLSSGSMYINLSVPLDVDGAIMASDNQNQWTLYVPKGSKAAYRSNQYWRGFKSIVEDESLVSGNGTPENTGSGNEDNDENGNNNDDELVPKYDYKNLTYLIDGVKYKMVLVDGGTLKPFYIMQTELPPNASFMIGDDYIGTLNKNLDNGVIKSEFRTFLDNLRKTTGIAFRLPTTSEWMYAARGGKKSKGYTYSGSNSIESVAWYKENSAGRDHDIATKQPNELGLYDMSGNFAEICNDLDDIYDIDGNLCGGNWADEEKFCKSTSSKQQPVSGKLGTTNYRNKNAFNPKYETIRLVYSAPK